MRQALLYLTLLCICSACQVTEQPSTHAEDASQAGLLETQSDIENAAPILLGSQLQNPFGVGAMKTALSSLHDEGLCSGVAISDIQTNHLYLRFLPADMDELDQLEQMDGIEWFPYPLDHEILAAGTYYHDPSLPDSQITYQYSSVPVNRSLPSVQYEILDSLFLEPASGTGAISADEYELIEERSFLLTGNEYDGTTQKTGRH